jgi:hypothetical protein
LLQKETKWYARCKEYTSKVKGMIMNACLQQVPILAWLSFRTLNMLSSSKVCVGRGFALQYSMSGTWLNLILQTWFKHVEKTFRGFFYSRDTHT